MKYVALLSGGKDSCFNLLHCERNGHTLVAAASLSPGEGKGMAVNLEPFPFVLTYIEELDSYLYQTVGQDAIELVAQALEVPLYRGVITGSAVEQGAEYGERDPGSSSGVDGDETEDLYKLLEDVLVRTLDSANAFGSILSIIQSRHPDIQGVSVGAILSNYQRVRVEHVYVDSSLCWVY